MGADCSIAVITTGSLENVAVKAPIGPREEVDNQTISQGSNPLIAKTAINNPQVKNQRLALSPIVESTSALIMALSTLVIVSNKTRPAMIRMMERRSMNQELIGFCLYKNVRKRGLLGGGGENPSIYKQIL
jgi:hypothetical protein